MASMRHDAAPCGKLRHLAARCGTLRRLAAPLWYPFTAFFQVRWTSWVPWHFTTNVSFIFLRSPTFPPSDPLTRSPFAPLVLSSRSCQIQCLNSCKILTTRERASTGTVLLADPPKSCPGNRPCPLKVLFLQIVEQLFADHRIFKAINSE